MLRRKSERKKNWYSIRDYGFGLWEIWYDEGEGTTARPVMSGDVASRYLFDREAARKAQELAEVNPTRRYMVKLAQSSGA